MFVLALFSADARAAALYEWNIKSSRVPLYLHPLLLTLMFYIPMNDAYDELIAIWICQ